ncbi:MAG: hypothetical protein WC365_06000 [Candidatus Babeliales bacterium]|jgi:hypothetical protein
MNEMFKRLGNFFLRYPRCTIGISALIVRIIPAYIFYGSCDIDAFTEIIGCILRDGPISYGIKNWNMLPSISFYLWFAGFLAVKTRLLLAVCIKLIPIFCDVALALLLYEMVLKKKAGHALGVGLLYALCPVSVVISTIHGQWESVFLLPLILSFYIRDYGDASYTASIIFGAVFGLSILIKPIGLLLLPFFFTPLVGIPRVLGQWWQLLKIIGFIGSLSILGAFVFLALTKHRLMDIGPFLVNNQTSIELCAGVFFIVLLMVGWGIGRKLYAAPAYIRRHVALHLVALSSFIVVIGCAFLIFIGLRFNILGLFDACLRYANKGPQGIGLRLIFSSLCPAVGTFLENRMILLIWVVLCASTYYRSKIDVFDAMIMVFAGIFCISGLCPHYLIWLIPCALFKGLYKSIGIYGLCTTMLYAIYYNPPQHCDWSFLYRLSFAPLPSYAYLAPPLCFVSNDSVVLVLGLVGNLLIPLSCWLILWSLMRTAQVCDDAWVKAPRRIPGLWFVRGIVFFSAAIFMCMLTTSSQSLSAAFDTLAMHRYASYAIVCNGSHYVLRSMAVLRTNASLYCNAVNLLLLWGCVWFIAIVWFDVKIKREREE